VLCTSDEQTTAQQHDERFPYFSACASNLAPSKRANPSPPACITLL
jgi:hypothetical protein